MANETVDWEPALPNTATPDIQQMVTKLKPKIQEKLDTHLKHCQALFYYKQVPTPMIVGVRRYLILVSQL